MDRFRSGGAGSTATVEAQFRAEIQATQDALRASSAEGRKQKRAVRRQDQQHQKYVKEHKVAAWDVRKSGNPWMNQDMACRILKKEETLDAVEGRYREPVREAMGACRLALPVALCVDAGLRLACCASSGFLSDTCVCCLTDPDRARVCDERRTADTPRLQACAGVPTRPDRVVHQGLHETPQAPK